MFITVYFIYTNQEKKILNVCTFRTPKTGMKCLLDTELTFFHVAVTFLYSFSFLGYVDKLGVAYEAPTVATGFGAYLAQVRAMALLV